MFGFGADDKRWHEEKMARRANKKEILVEAIKADQGKVVYLKAQALKLSFIVDVRRSNGTRDGKDYDSTCIEYLEFDNSLDLVKKIWIDHKIMTFDEITKAIKEAK
ncbi:hypothetical protein ACFH1V_12770 [Acinetobacter baumannii]